MLDDNIGYIYYESFSDAVGNGNLSDMLQELAICKGLIIDVRNNSGGQLTNADRIAARFTNKKVLTGYICHKTGPGHSDFSEPYPVYLEPSGSVRWQKPVCVLTNRSSYSATNDFVNTMKQLENITIVGDRTGGRLWSPLLFGTSQRVVHPFLCQPHVRPADEPPGVRH